ncbi:MAG: histidine kinase [Patescibacteria group bacterium]
MGRSGAGSPGPFFTRIAWAFIGALSIFALTSFLSYHLERRLILRVNRLLRTSMSWAGLAEETENLEAALEKYLAVGDERSRTAYTARAGELRARALALVGNPTLLQDVLAGEDAQGMVETMLAQGEAVIDAQERRSLARGGDPFHAFSVTGEFLRGRIHLAVMDLLRREAGNYRLISNSLVILGRAALLLIIGGLLLAVLVLVLLSYRLTRPLAELAEAAGRVSQGDFSREIPVRERDEVGHVAEAFNQMSRALARLIQDLHEKSALEVRLREREVENLAMQNMLQQARLQALQAQMNPHFFFNTLNAGVHLANLEKAERTAVFFENVGRLFRYSLRSPGPSVALEEELNHVENYVALLHMRFGEKSFSFVKEIDPSLLDTPLPPLTLQPLVENAYLHGLAGRTGGTIAVRVRRQRGAAVIEVADDGRGMTREAIEEALRPYDGRCRDASPIGLANVIARLRLWTGEERPVEIRTEPGRGTAIVLSLRERE